ncbi:LamG-like jellyroll fold domain-containing protein [uncultured Prevotella sp.]|uniref:LamG-like jellyroll fold domain-containing protein n=1 Tax=uncultured Prevotella sp. TaxID=159272 RepID=UPI0025F82033|nr:LamG-like jellyroll fold domain-containing protein [uncultured Prevotella sp.]
MTIIRKSLVLSFSLLLPVGIQAQEQRASSSMYLQALKKADVNVPFAISAEGKRYAPTWGFDLAWINEQNIMKGVNHMGKENVGIGRIAFRYTEALENDTLMSSNMISVLRQRINLFNKIDNKLPLTMTADQEAVSPTDDDPNRCPPEYYVKNKVANNNHWAAMINSHVHWIQQNTSHPVVGISPFNEGDYWSVEEGATAAKQWQVAKLLKEHYPRCQDIAMVGGNTLNDDKALAWYTPGKQYYDWGNTHQLAGSFDNFAKFFTQVAKDGKIGYADEMHNVAEAMVGLEYGMTVGIWWGFDSRARGEFCQISRNGVRLAYGEHRDNWTAASVYRHDDGHVKAFIGSSERQAKTTTYQLVSTEREVYYDGFGPVHEVVSKMPGGTGYQTGQTNAERVIDVTWGEDVPPSVIDGTYKIISKVAGESGNALAYTTNGSNIMQQAYRGIAKQQWTVKPATNRTGGDLSFYDIESVDNAKVRMNVKNYALTKGDLIAWTQDTPSSNEQWYLEYVGDGYYYVRNRESGLYLSTAVSSGSGRLIQTPMQDESLRDRQLFRFIPVDVAYDVTAPAKPSGVSAQPHAASVRIQWTANGEEDLNAYMVLRAPQGTTDWDVIARGLTTTYFVDNTCRQGTSYIYKVKAIDLSQNISEASDVVAARPTGDQKMIARWNFEDNLYDDTNNMMDMAMTNGVSPRFIEDVDDKVNHKVGQKALSLANQFTQLPYEVASSDELTISMWVNWRSSTTQWQRIFDFGNDTEHYMFLTPNNSYTNVMRFAIKNGGDEQTLDCQYKLTDNMWKHVAVVLGKERVVIYVDGEEAASSTGITIRPSDIHPVLNYLGRSQFASDPNLTAYLDDVRIYNYALSGDEVKATMQDLPAGISEVETAPQSTDIIYGLDGIQRTTPGKGLKIKNNKKVVF